MKLRIALLLTAVLRLSAQAPLPKLTCDRLLMVANGLATSCETRDYTFDSTDALTVANVNGNVSLYTWDGPQVTVRAQILAAADTDNQAAALGSQVQVAVSDQVKVTGPSSSARQTWSSNLEIYVPAATVLHLTTINGNIVVQATSADIDVRTVNGSITIINSSGNVSANTVNGGITLTAAAPWNGETILAKTVNGSIDLAMPADCSAHVDLSTTLGSISTTLSPANWTITGTHRGVSFDLGSGGPLVSASTVTGSISLR